MRYHETVHLELPYDEAVSRVREALAEQGFGVITEIDMKATLQQKIGETIEDYVVLGACNPGLAHQALDVDRTMGLLLPCNVVVRAETGEGTGGSVVELLDPQVMVQVPENEDLRPVAEEAGRRLTAVAEALRG